MQRGSPIKRAIAFGDTDALSASFPRLINALKVIPVILSPRWSGDSREVVEGMKSECTPFRLPVDRRRLRAIEADSVSCESWALYRSNLATLQLEL